MFYDIENKSANSVFPFYVYGKQLILRETVSKNNPHNKRKEYTKPKKFGLFGPHRKKSETVLRENRKEMSEKREKICKCENFRKETNVRFRHEFGNTP